MKNIARIASRLLSVTLALAAGPAFAGTCYIHAMVSSTANPKARIVLDVVQVDIPYYARDELKVVLNKPEEENLQARAIAYAKRNLSRAEGSVDTSAVYDKAGLSYAGTCYRDAIRAEEMRVIGIERSAVLHGTWSSEKLPASPQGAAPAAKGGNAPLSGPLLTRTPDTRKPTPEEVAAQKKRDDAFKKSKDDAAAAAKAKAAQDAAAAKVREDKRRQVCMQPEHRGDCSCLRFFPPDPTRKACSK